MDAVTVSPMTKSDERTADLRRVAIYPEDAFLLSLTATVLKQTQAETFRTRLRRHLRKLLADRGVDPDRAWGEKGPRE